MDAHDILNMMRGMMKLISENTGISISIFAMILGVAVFILGLDSTQRVQASQISRLESEKQEMREDIKLILVNTSAIKTDLEVLKIEIRK